MKSKKSVFTFLKNNRKKLSVLAALMICVGVYAAAGGAFPGSKKVFTTETSLSTVSI